MRRHREHKKNVLGLNERDVYGVFNCVENRLFESEI